MKSYIKSHEITIEAKVTTILSHHSIIIESPISRHPMFQTTGVAAFRFMRRCKAMGCAMRTSRPETQNFIELVSFNSFLIFYVMVDSVN